MIKKNQENMLFFPLGNDTHAGISPYVLFFFFAMLASEDSKKTKKQKSVYENLKSRLAEVSFTL